MDMTGNYFCPKCDGKGYVWDRFGIMNSRWQVHTCPICDGHRFVTVDKDGLYMKPFNPMEPIPS